MEQRDYLKDQIEQLGRVLGNMLAEFLRLKTAGQLYQGIAVSNEQLKEELDLDIPTILALDSDSLHTYLSDRKLTPDHMEILSKYLEETGLAMMEETPEEGKAYLHQALAMMDMIDETTKTFSFERMHRRAKIKEMLGETS
ncbi:MAG: hypothetical protein AAFS00_02150 [Bacteroidota bacterium]